MQAWFGSSSDRPAKFSLEPFLAAVQINPRQIDKFRSAAAPRVKLAQTPDGVHLPFISAARISSNPAARLDLATQHTGAGKALPALA